VSEKLDLGGPQEVSRTIGDRLREPSLAKARKFGLPQTTKPHSLPFSRRSKFICDPRPAQSQPKPPAPFLLSRVNQWPLFWASPFLGFWASGLPSFLDSHAAPGGVALHRTERSGGGSRRRDGGSALARRVPLQLLRSLRPRRIIFHHLTVSVVGCLSFFDSQRPKCRPE